MAESEPTAAPAKRSRAPGLALLVVGLAIGAPSAYVLQQPEKPPEKIISPEGHELQGPVRDVSVVEELMKSGLPIAGIAVGLAAVLGGVFLIGRSRV